jgi:hypothetical protein
MEQPTDREQLAERIVAWQRETERLLQRSRRRREQLEIAMRASNRIVERAVRTLRARI